MQDLIQTYGLSEAQWIVAILCAVMIGMSKTGISGIGLAVVPILAAIFGGKPSVGLLLPILVFADIFAVIYYNRHAEWKHIIRLMPWAIAGILIALFVGNQVSDSLFKQLIGIVVIVGIGLMILQDIRKKQVKIPDHWAFSALLGLSGGFATMIGNAAGPILIIYLLSMRLPKNQFIGTGAWFFFIVNVLKVPLHITVWKTISLESFLFDVLMIPGIIGGAFLGIYLVKLFPERAYRIFIIGTTLVAALLLF
jgi:uncharacterized membrane protein YfcA